MSDEADCVTIGDERGRIVIWPPRFYGDSSSSTRVDIAAGTFRGSVEAYGYGGFKSFHAELIRLYETLTGEVVFPALEGLDLKFRGDGRGHVAVSVRAIADYMRPIEMRVGILLDQTHLPPIIAAVDRVLVKAPL